MKERNSRTEISKKRYVFMCFGLIGIGILIQSIMPFLTNNSLWNSTGSLIIGVGIGMSMSRSFKIEDYD